MSKRELDRVGVIEAAIAGRLTQHEAAKQLGLSVRQVKRLVRRYRQDGPAALASRRRGRPSNNRLAGALREQALELVGARYGDFGPTLAHEKLTELHGLKLSVETLRKWMIDAELWKPKRRRYSAVHQLRERRPCHGELLQVDGSPHAWFEERGERCTLLVFIDDATGDIGHAHFAPTETTEAYMVALQHYLAQHGRPAALYSDRHSIFRLTQSECANGHTLTQFGRALRELNIEAIHANTPQAKGRVERANQTLQDRLVKELRLAGICDIEAANRFLPRFLDDFNRRFAVTPKRPENAHRTVYHSPEQLDRIFCLHHQRRLSKSLSIQFQNVLYQVDLPGNSRRLRGTELTVCEHFDGRITLLSDGKTLPYTTFRKGERQPALADEKTLNQRVDNALAQQAARKPRKPAASHPWRQSLKQPTPVL